ncbi:glycoside hydrolase family 64 protein [Actinoalloteichus hymeniacidonis]|uniref:GH64 domain-containing protein n=1 Tax=Actinoalloteichus hymeniacidonis TaxID=340345 RepID=A0AAC9HMU8_9PSEU|nr:glycoside hydrolase family 64 protein [Actinoalloteichus hymeniacidonis]AOS62073.1 hypothetical protein TL08_06240 [Actinoalloteichus hymeniacidonis]MBB5909905.1 hypothetical protein [Actinoalloteichus hymeniacidonis]
MATRRLFLGGLAASAIGGIALASELRRGVDTNAIGVRRLAVDAHTLPLTVVNNTGAYDNASIHMYIVGVDRITGNQARITPDGTIVAVSEADNGPDGWADYSIPLAGNGPTTINLSSMSGRVYFSMGEKLRFKVNPGNALVYPAGWVSADPNYRTLHDCMEFTFDDTGMYCNTTMVDMFSIPMEIQLTGEQSQTVGTLVDGGRAGIFNGMAQNSDYSQLVVDDLRVIAPGHGINSGQFSGSYFDPYIDEVWSKYAGETLTINANNRTFTGRVNGGIFEFDGGVAPISKPSTSDVFFCNGALHAPNDGVTGPVAAVLGAGLNRSTLHNTNVQPSTDPAAFYQTPVSNHYSRVLHENAVDGRSYGFPFDDVAEFASYVQDHAPTGITVTLTPF